MPCARLTATANATLHRLAPVEIQPSARIDPSQINNLNFGERRLGADYIRRKLPARYCGPLSPENRFRTCNISPSVAEASPTPL